MVSKRKSLQILPVSLVCLLGLVTCSVSPVVQVRTPERQVESGSSVDDLIDLAEDARGPAASAYLIQAAELLIDEREIDEAAALIDGIGPPAGLDEGLQIRLAIVQSEIDLAMERPQDALNALNEAPTSTLQRDGNTAVYDRLMLNRALALLGVGRYQEAVTSLSGITSPGAIPRQQQQDLLWSTLQRLSDGQLSALAAGADSYELRGWIELARAMRADQYSLTRQMAALTRWRGVWNRHSAATLLPVSLQRLEAVWNGRPEHIALLLPLQDQIGRAVQDGFLSAYYEALDQGEPVPEVSVFDTSGVTEIRGLYDTVVATGADLVIGPLNKELVRQLDNYSMLPVATLALNYTDFESRNSDQFYQFGLAPEDEIEHMAKLARAEGYLNAAIVAPDNADYQRLQQAFTNTWQNQGGRVVSTVYFTAEGEFSDTVKQLLAIDASESRAARIRTLLPRNEITFTPRRRGDIDFVFLMANPRQGRQIKPTLAFYFAGDLPVFALSSINDGLGNQVNNQDLDGIVFTDTPWVLDQIGQFKQQVNTSLRSTQGPLQRLRALGIDAFRLYPRLGQLAAGELLNFRGATGYLSMNRVGIIERIPQTARFVDGQTVTYEASTQAVNRQ